jgi:hypothetical protein
VVVVEGCGCGGYFIETTLFDQRLTGVTRREREELAARVRGIPIMDRDAWITTTDGTMDGRLAVRIERPTDRTRSASVPWPLTHSTVA